MVHKEGLSDLMKDVDDRQQGIKSAIAQDLCERTTGQAALPGIGRGLYNPQTGTRKDCQDTIPDFLDAFDAMITDEELERHRNDEGKETYQLNRGRAQGYL